MLGWARPAGANMEMCIENCALKSICKQHFGEACEMYKNGGSNFFSLEHAGELRIIVLIVVKERVIHILTPTHTHNRSSGI